MCVCATVFTTTHREKSDPFAVENLDSNMVLESEIEKVQAKAAAGDLTAVMRKGALETKLMVSYSKPYGTGWHEEL